MGKFRGMIAHPKLLPVSLATIGLILVGILVLFSNPPAKFNFNYSKITIEGTNISEELHYTPYQPYHTLYRNFENPIYSQYYKGNRLDNYVIIKTIECSLGNPYFKEYSGKCYNSSGSTICYPYTESNEYGCTFGNTLEFLKDNKYIIKSKYELHPENLFYINNNYYIKFVAYSQKNHVKLSKKNFIVNSNSKIVKNKRYYQEENVVIYIQYSGDISNFRVITQEDFEFDSRSSLKGLIVAFFPALFIFFLWFVFGRETSYEEIPKELSTFPNKRKFWEVAAYFNPPFSKINKDFFAAVMLDFYERKIIDIKEKEEKIYIKLNKFKGDDIEKQVYEILEDAKLNLDEKRDKKIIDGEYFNLKKAMQKQNYVITISPIPIINKDLKEKGKKYLKTNLIGITLTLFLLFTILFIPTIMASPVIIGLYGITYILITIFFNNSIFARFKEEYYVEFQKWQSFKRYLKNSFSIKSATHKTLIIWKEYLIYATALGVPEKVIKELKYNHIITEKQANLYAEMVVGNSLGLSSVTASSGGMGGGFGGAGGGGVGGGGGGGR